MTWNLSVSFVSAINPVAVTPAAPVQSFATFADCIDVALGATSTGAASAIGSVASAACTLASTAPSILDTLASFATVDMLATGLVAAAVAAVVAYAVSELRAARR